MTDYKKEETVENNRFSPTELHLILNRLGQASFNSEHKEMVAKCLTKKKEAGITIDDQAIAICISENKPKVGNTRAATGHPVPNAKIISLGKP